MRAPEIVLILLSIVIIGLAGFGPLFAPRDRADTIAQECEMFYGPSGREAVAHCMTEMAQRAAEIGRSQPGGSINRGRRGGSIATVQRDRAQPADARPAF